MGLFGTKIERAWNLHFFDDDTFIFRQLEVEKGWLIERDNQGKACSAYMLPYKTRKQFEGYGKIPSCRLTLTYSRDILFDCFNQLKVEEKPEKGKGLKEKTMSGIASATLYHHEVEAKPTSSVDKMILFTGIVAVILGLSIGFQVLMSRGA